MRYPAAAFCVLLLAMPVLAADIDGKWTATVDGMDGNKMELTYLFKAEGNRLTGKVTSPMGDMNISEGKIDGNSIEFTASSDQFSVTNKGTISGDEIKLSSEVMGTAMSVVLKRVK